VPSLVSARRSPRVLVSWGIAAALAVVTARTVAGDLARLHVQARRSGPRVTVVVARRDLALGHVVATGDVTTKLVFAADRPADSLATTASAAGLVVGVPVLRGEPVLRRSLIARNATVVRAGTRIVRIPVGDGVVPAPDSVVDVLATFAGGGDETPTIAVARGAVVVEDGTAAQARDRDRAAGVLVIVPEAAAARVAYALANATVTLVLAPIETACCSPLG